MTHPQDRSRGRRLFLACLLAWIGGLSASCAPAPAASAAPATPKGAPAEQVRALFKERLLRDVTAFFENQLAAEMERRHQSREVILSEAAKALSAQVRPVTPEGIPGLITEQILKQLEPAFRVSEEEAARILAGRFDDEGNRNRLEEAAKSLDSLGGPDRLPGPIAEALSAYREGKVSNGFDLEFSSRFIQGSRDMVAGRLNAPLVKDREKPPPPPKGD